MHVRDEDTQVPLAYLHENYSRYCDQDPRALTTFFQPVTGTKNAVSGLKNCARHERTHYLRASGVPAWKGTW